MFEGATKFNQNLDNWKIGNSLNTGTDRITMANMFKNAVNFNRNIATNDKVWKVELVTDMKSMFEGATEFNEDISNWDVTLAAAAETAFNNMFNGASKFQQKLCPWIAQGLAADDVSDINNMFENSNCPTPNALVVTGGATAATAQVCCKCNVDDSCVAI